MSYQYINRLNLRRHQPVVFGVSLRFIMDSNVVLCVVSGQVQSFLRPCHKPFISTCIRQHCCIPRCCHTTAWFHHLVGVLYLPVVSRSQTEDISVFRTPTPPPPPTPHRVAIRLHGPQGGGAKSRAQVPSAIGTTLS